jgi:phage terminase large subunit-like protein
MRVLGTRYHPEDLYGYLIEQDPNFRNSFFIMPGVFGLDTGEAVDLIENDDGSFSLPENATVWDPVGFSVEEVLTRREGMTRGDFESQYQNRVEFLRGDYFTADWFRYYDDEPAALVNRLGMMVWMGVDLAASVKSSADEFAIVVVGIIPKIFEIYVLDHISGRFTFNRQKELLVEMFDTWDPVRSYVEANAYQAVLESTAAEEFPDIRTHPVWTTEDKITRAIAFQDYYEKGKVFHRKGRSDKLEGQLTGFPHVKLKDLFDALYIAVWGAMRGGRRRGKRREEPRVFGS